MSQVHDHMTTTHCALLRIGNHPETTAFNECNSDAYREKLNKDLDWGLGFDPESGGYCHPDDLAGQMILRITVPYPVDRTPDQ